MLRNLSQKGIGFFIESSSFYPDFIIWIVEDKKQRILFVDPKRIRETRNFNNPKVIFCREQVKELEARINAELKAGISKILKHFELCKIFNFAYL